MRKIAADRNYKMVKVAGIADVADSFESAMLSYAAQAGKKKHPSHLSILALSNLTNNLVVALNEAGNPAELKVAMVAIKAFVNRDPSFK
jgi:hypothetical protein